MARRFLQFVGIVYIVLGFVGLVGMHWPSAKVVLLTGIASTFLVVTPLRLTIQNGVATACIGEPRSAWGCNLGDGDIAGAIAVLSLLCALSILGGVVAVWAASTRNPAARYVWLGLVAVSAGVSLWNVPFLFEMQANALFAFVAILWTGAYAVAWSLTFHPRQHSAPPGV